MQTSPADTTKFIATVDRFAAGFGLASYSDLVREIARLEALSAERFALLTDAAEAAAGAALHLDAGAEENIVEAIRLTATSARQISRALQRADVRPDLGELPANVVLLAQGRKPRPLSGVLGGAA